MAGLDGFQLTAGIKSINPQAAVIIMTAFDAPHLREKMHSVGASEFLCKPFELEELLAALNRSLENSASTRIVGRG
jgi:DNA-binding response OmpR family regulator